MDRKSASGKSAARRDESAGVANLAAGIAGLLLSAWLVYGTVTIDPFRWGQFAEELIVALCALFALRLLCVIRLPNWVSIAAVILPPAGIAVFGALFLPERTDLFLRALCIASAAGFSLFTARQLDKKPDGVLLCAILMSACAPVLFSADTRLLDEVMRALTMAGVFFTVLSVRRKNAGLACLAAVVFALGGAAGYYAAFAGFGAGVGALLLAPKRKRGGWILAAALTIALPVAARLAAGRFLPEGSALFSGNADGAASFVPFLRTHLLRALALGLFAASVRFFFEREDAAIPAVLSLAACAVSRLIPFAGAPDVWMEALPFCALAGVGIAKIARGRGR